MDLDKGENNASYSDDYLEELLKSSARSESEDLILFRGLKALYPEMSVMDIVICREVYTNLCDEHPSIYEEIVSRLVNEKLEDIPCEFWSDYFREEQIPLEARCAIDSKTGGLLETKELRLFPSAYDDEYSKGAFDIKRAIWKVKERGYIDFKVDGIGNPYNNYKDNNKEAARDRRNYYFIPFVSVELREDVLDALASADLTHFATYCGYDYNIERLLMTREEEMAELDRRFGR
ncbi:MAG: hypothetical protein M3275_00365 [Thermoproteota archaeon]|nr:hypothetical protein [Thermoproteota archaeon]MDQ3966829.1 hypothetical protein [Thermoproteota archaeon]